MADSLGIDGRSSATGLIASESIPLQNHWLRHIVALPNSSSHMPFQSHKPTITSPTNPKVKQTLRLRQSSERRQTGHFLIDGRREIELAIAHGFRVETVFFSESDSAVASDWPEGLQLAQRQMVSSAILQRLSYGQRGDTPVAVAQRPQLGLARLKLDATSLILVLDRTEKPGNLGACLRTASACGVHAVVLTDPICEIFNPNAIRASRGTVFTIPMAVATPEELIAFCAARSLHVLTARVDGSHRLWDCTFTGGSAIVFGNESQGLGANWDHPQVDSFSIPMSGVADSLNLSISAAVTLYEAVRQRTNI